jgi:alkaline phosphatase
LGGATRGQPPAAYLFGAGFPPNAIDRTPEREEGFFLRGVAPGTQAVHTASDVALSAFSSGSRAWQDFVGVMDNTDVFFKIVRATSGHPGSR